MHEVSLVQGMLSQITDLADRNQASTVIGVTVVIGPFSGIVVDSFSFAFEALKHERKLTRNARLIIETPAPKVICRDCGSESIQERTDAAMRMYHHRQISCIHCGSDQYTVADGDALILKQLEME